MGAPPASSCRHGRRSWASARFTCDLQWGGGVGSSLRHNFLWGYIVRACHDGVACFQWYEEEIGCHHMSRGDFVAIHPSLQKVDRSKLFEVFRLLRCNASCVPQRCKLNISFFEDENAQEFNVVTYETVENRGINNKPCVRYDERAGGTCTVQNGAATVASQEGHIRPIRRRFHCRVPHKHTVPIKDSYGTAWIFQSRWWYTL